MSDKDTQCRTECLIQEARDAIRILEENICDLYTPKGLYKVFTDGFFPVPFMLDTDKKYPNATKWQTAIFNGGVIVIDDNGNPIDTKTRYNQIITSYDR